LPSERRRLQKEAKAAEKRAKEEARGAAEAAAIAEASAVLERQAARPDATAAILTSVLLKRGGTASQEVVARTRAKRDSLKAAEMRARKPVKAMPKERNAAERLRTDGETSARLIKKAAGSAKPAAKLERENAALKEMNERLRRAAMNGKKFAQYWSLADPLFEDPKDSAIFVRKVVACAHPDKHTGHKAAATAVTQTLNHLLGELRRSQA
jgi:hypothetical protein